MCDLAGKEIVELPIKSLVLVLGQERSGLRRSAGANEPCDLGSGDSMRAADGRRGSNPCGGSRSVTGLTWSAPKRAIRAVRNVRFQTPSRSSMNDCSLPTERSDRCSRAGMPVAPLVEALARTTPHAPGSAPDSRVSLTCR